MQVLRRRPCSRSARLRHLRWAGHPRAGGEGVPVWTSPAPPRSRSSTRWWFAIVPLALLGTCGFAAVQTFDRAWRDSSDIVDALAPAFGMADDATDAGGGSSISIEVYCRYLIDVDRYHGTHADCLTDPDVARLLPSDEEDMYFEVVADAMRSQAEDHCFARLSEEAAALRGYEGYRSGVVEQDDVAVQSCVEDQMLRIKGDLIAYIAGIDVAALTGIPQDDSSRAAWIIDGVPYNDPWGLDYKNDSEDTFGDGR
jgi:hypothetical protein